MLRNYYNLKILVKELLNFKGLVFTDCFSQEKNVVHFFLQNENGGEFVLQFSSDPKLGSLLLRNKFVRTKSNSAVIFPLLIGQKIYSIELIPNQRIIKIETEDYLSFAQLFGGSQNNIFLCDKNMKVLDAFKNSERFIGKSYTIGEVEEFNSNKLTLRKFFEKKRFLERWYSEILFSRITIEPNTFLDQIDKKQLEEVFYIEKELLDEIERSTNFILYRYEDDFFVSCILFEKWKMIEEFRSISKAMFHCYLANLKHQNFLRRKKELTQQIERELARVNSKLVDHKILSHSENLIKQYLNWGTLLINQPILSMKGLTELEVIDFDGNKVIIPLKPELSVLRNAEMYFEKSKKLRNTIERTKDLLLLLVPRKQQLVQLAEELKTINEHRKFDEFLMKNKDELNEFVKKEKSSPEAKFRRFDLLGGYILYVGKSAQSNEDLTFKFARGNDYWLHARGVSGSHCVLRCPTKEKPPKEILIKAAEISAFYSKAKNAKNVPVSYTQRKFVKKPKGVEIGKVVMMQEDVLFVTPKLPKVE